MICKSSAESQRKTRVLQQEVEGENGKRSYAGDGSQKDDTGQKCGDMANDHNWQSTVG